MKKALLVIDMVNDFLLEGAPLKVPGGLGIIPNVKREIDAARAEGSPVIYVTDAHDKDDWEFEIWPEHAVDGTEGAAIHEEIAPRPGDIRVKKKRYSAFFNTDLDDILKEHAIDTVVLVGVLTNICVMYTAADAKARGYDVVVVEDAVSAIDDETNRFALEQMKNVNNAEIR